MSALARSCPKCADWLDGPKCPDCGADGHQRLLRTLHDRVLVRRVEHSRTDGGLFIPIAAEPRKNLRGDYTAEAIVVAVGKGADVLEPREIAGLEMAIEVADDVGSDLVDALRERIARLRAAARPPPVVPVGARIFYPSWIQQKAVVIDGEALVEIAGCDIAAIAEEGPAV